MALTTFTSGQVLTAAQMNAVQANDYNQTVSTKTASYTLVAADKGTRVAMNSASATTITVNTSLFSAGDTLVLQNISTGVCTVTAGTATVSSAGSLAIPQNGSGILYFTSAGVSIFYPSAVTASAAGLVCVKAETAFSAVTSVTADSVFTSTYTNYLVKIIFNTSTANDGLMKFRVGGVATSTNYNRQRLVFNSTSVTTDQLNSQTSINLGSTNGAFEQSFDLNIYNPQIATATNIFSLNQNNFANYTTGNAGVIISANQSASTAFDGIEFSVATGTFTGKYAIYGYSKTV